MFQYPTKVFYITQKFGVKGKNYGTLGHRGLDLRIKNDPNSDIYAARDGKVIFVDTVSDFNWFKPRSWRKGSPYGNHVILEHNIDGVKYFTFYAHLEQPYFKVGDIVKTGQLIAKGGNTGLSSAPHLHFEVRKDVNDTKHSINPEKLLKAKLEADIVVPEWAEKAVTWVRAHGLFQITNQRDIRDAVKSYRLYLICKGELIK